MLPSPAGVVPPREAVGASRVLPGRADSFKLSDRRKQVEPMRRSMGPQYTFQDTTTNTGDTKQQSRRVPRPLEHDMRFESFQELVIPGVDTVAGGAGVGAGVGAGGSGGGGGTTATRNSPAHAAAFGGDGRSGVGRQSDAVTALIAHASHHVDNGGGRNNVPHGMREVDLFNVSGVHHVEVSDRPDSDDDAGAVRSDESGDECDHVHGDDYIKPTDLYELRVRSTLWL